METSEVEPAKEESMKLSHFIESSNNGSLVKILDRLGKLPENYDEKPLLRLLKHESSKIRYLAVKNLAKLSRLNFLNLTLFD